MWHKLWSHRLFLIIALAAFLRLFLLNRVPPSLNWDEVAMGYTAYSVGETGMDEWGERLPIFFRSYGEWKSAVYIYVLVPFIKLFGLNAWGVRLPSALAGILAVWLTYLVGSRLYGQRAGTWAAFFLAISPWHLLLSRPAFEANVSLTLILAGLYFFLQFSQKSKIYLLISSAIAFGLAPHTYNSAKVVVPILVLYLIWRTRLYRHLKNSLLYFFILGLFALPILLNLFSGRAQHRYSQVGVSTNEYDMTLFIQHRLNPAFPPLVGKLIFNRYTYTLHQTAYNALSYLNPGFLLVEAGDHVQHHVPYFGSLYLAEYILLLIGIFTLFRKGSHRPLRLLPLVIIGLGIIPAALTREQYHLLRSILTLPGWQLLAGLGLATITSRPWRRILLGVLFLQVAVFLVAYFWWYPQISGRDWQGGYQETAAYVQAHESEYDQIVFTKWYGEPQLFLAFYNRWDPTWFQAENQANLRYESEGNIWLDQLPQYSIGKYTFKYLKWADETKSPRTLFVGKADDFYSDSHIVKTVSFPDGSPAFLLVEP